MMIFMMAEMKYRSHQMTQPICLKLVTVATQEGTIGVLAGQLGLISHYARDYPDIPYLVKLNSKSHMVKTSQRDPVSQALWDMDDVMSLVHNGINVVGIGYTIYIGSEYEHEMMSEAFNSYVKHMS